ncbi:MAG: energy coupling factor transporter S component ThiW [Firmicutes bacterium HGW-Firmicutes-7]|nr:MAG: energy coupling factor transporter S component ThiW [Firmicutes bacterium HGW-Firmicutes-7]
MYQTKKIALSGVLIALGVALSPLYIPIGTAKCFPLQHLINVISAVLLGPLYAVANAFVISLLRNIFGMGSLLAFPGSMIGALLAGLLYVKYKSQTIAAIGELIGTGILGSLVSAPIFIHLMGKEAGIFFFVIPFMLSSFVGTSIAMVLLRVPALKKLLNYE